MDLDCELPSDRTLGTLGITGSRPRRGNPKSGMDYNEKNEKSPEGECKKNEGKESREHENVAADTGKCAEVPALFLHYCLPTWLDRARDVFDWRGAVFDE